MINNGRDCILAVTAKRLHLDISLSPSPPPSLSLPPSFPLSLTIVVHDLSASQLLIGRVDLSPEDLVEGTSSGQDDVRVLYLYHPLTQTDQVGTYANGTTGDLE